MLAAHQAALVDRVRARLRREPAVAPPALPRVPLDAVADALALDGFERETLAVVAAPHLDDQLRDEIRRFHGDRARGHVDAALVVALLSPGREERLLAAARLHPEDRLAQAGLVEYVAPPLSHYPSPLELEMVPTPRLVGLLRGVLRLDSRLAEIARLVPTRAADGDGVIASRDRERLCAAFRGLCAGRDAARVALHGPAELGAERVASAMAHAAGRNFLLRVELALLPRPTRELAARLRHLVREAGALDALLTIHVEGEAGGLGAALSVVQAPVLLLADDPDPARLRVPTALSKMMEPPDPGVRASAWQAELARRGVDLPEVRRAALARDYPVPRSGVATAVTVAMATGARLEETARLVLRGQLGRFAERSRSRARLEDLVLDDETREQLHEIAGAMRGRAAVLEGWGFGARVGARGIVALFEGPPGTGKTLAANALANELDIPLYRVDVSTIVDRYVGETEKHLRQLFAEAYAERAALLFDEADSLFARRVEVNDATDKYANMHVNVLLNLIEDHEGLVLLTTNLKRGFDSAFLRRIGYKVGFRAPGPLERQRLWERCLPPAVPLEPGACLEELAADYAVSGGEIKNAALRAAYLAGGQQPITMEMLRRAIVREREAAGSVVSAA